MKTFLHCVGEIIAYLGLIIFGMAAIIGIGYLLGWGISVHERTNNTTSGVCTSTLCQ